MDKTQMAVEVFNKRAQQYQDKHMDVGRYHEVLDLFCNSLTRQRADILELASGPGNITRYLLNQRPDFRILGTDLAPNMIDLAKNNNPEATFQLMDCREMLKLDGHYDGIMCGFVLPYLSKEEAQQLITDAAVLLHQGGVLYLSTMEDDYSKSGMYTSSSGDQVYMYYHEAGYLVKALEENGFRILDLRRQDFPLDDGTKMVDLLLLAGK